MINSPLAYLFTLALIATVFHLLQTKTSLKIFKFVPAVVFIYAFSMLLASLGMFEYNKEINDIYKLAKTNLLPAMLFLMLLQINFRHFFRLGRKLLIAYLLALFSLSISFVIVALIFDFDTKMASAFGALAGSWMGGTANMLAVGSALEVDSDAFGYALIVDSVNYTLWVMLLLFLVPFASYFNRFTKSDEEVLNFANIGCSCNLGVPRYWFLILLALIVSLISQFVSLHIGLLSKTTTMVLIASALGVLGSFSKLKELNGSSEVASSMLYMLIALIGSKAVFDSFENVGVYVFAGFVILIIHAMMMIIGAKIFKLDLFSIAVASLSNIGGVASAPILAASFNKNLVSVGVLMAIMGYLIGTFGGLMLGNILISLAQ